MSDELNQPASAGGGSIGPDGTPFDPARWDSYVQHTKAEKEELKQRLQSESSVWEDEQAVLARLAEKFPHLMVDDDDTPEPEYEPDAPVHDPRVDQHEQQIQQFAAWQAEQQYNADLKQVAGDRELSAQAKRTIKSWTADGGNNRAALEAAVKEWIEFEDEIRGPARKPAPTPPQPGKAGDQKRDPRDREQRRAAMAAAIEAANQ